MQNCLEVNPRIPKEFHIDLQYKDRDLNGTSFKDDEEFVWKFEHDGPVQGGNISCDELMATELIVIDKPEPTEIKIAEANVTHISIKRDDGNYSSMTKGIIIDDEKFEIFGVDDPDELFELLGNAMITISNLIQSNVNSESE